MYQTLFSIIKTTISNGIGNTKLYAVVYFFQFWQLGADKQVNLCLLVDFYNQTPNL